MNNGANTNYLVAVLGAGPAGLFASRQLAVSGAQVVLFNRDIKPGGLAEYGIYYDKFKMKDGLRKQFRNILATPQVNYYGNVVIGQRADLSLPDLRSIGFQAILVTVGAQGTKWLGLPGEDLRGVYHAKDLVYHYNKLPPFSTKSFFIGKRVALIGAGNVMLDIAHWLVHDLQVDEVIAVVRRGPAEVKFTRKELEYVACNIDQAAFQTEMNRVAPVMQSIGQDVQAAKDYILSAMLKAEESDSKTRFLFDFLASPVRIIGEGGLVRGLEIENTTLVSGHGEPQARRLGTRRVIPADTVIFCIGDRVEDNFGLPVRMNEFVKNPNPCFPVNGVSYEAFIPDLDVPVDRVFIAGWSREASSGLVGIARKDGENGAQAVLQYLQTQPELVGKAEALHNLKRRLDALGKPIITQAELVSLESAENLIAQQNNLEEFKFSTNQEMLAAISPSISAVDLPGQFISFLKGPGKG